jgi:predicted DNA-binding ribbon-helix-helix protein
MAERDPQIAKQHRPTADSDFAAWIFDQAAALKEGRFADLDVDELVDEVESLAKRDFKAFTSALRIILLHMLKWDYQPEKRGNSWRRSINAARKAAWAELASSPSFRSRISEATNDAYDAARLKASDETGVFEENFPTACPYEWDDIMFRPHNLEADRVPRDQNDPHQGYIDPDGSNLEL